MISITTEAEHNQYLAEYELLFKKGEDELTPDELIRANELEEALSAWIDKLDPDTKNLSGWNHRVLAHADGEAFWLKIHEVYYDKAGKPGAHTEDGILVCGESISSIKWSLNRMLMCLKKPILYAGDRFPEEFTEPVIPKNG